MYIVNKTTVRDLIVNPETNYFNFQARMSDKVNTDLISGIVEAEYLGIKPRVCVLTEKDTEDFLVYGIYSFRCHFFGGYYIPKDNSRSVIILYRYSEYFEKDKKYINNLLSVWHKGKVLKFG